MAEAGAIRRARNDIAEGELWRARDRLISYVRQRPDDEVAVDLLGSVFHQMGDTPNAGRYWMLANRSDDAAERARGVFLAPFADQPDALIRALPRMAGPDAYPSVVRRRFVAAGISDWPTVTRRRDSDRTAGAHEFRRRDNVAAALVIGCLLVGTVGVWIVGVIYLVTRIWA